MEQQEAMLKIKGEILNLSNVCFDVLHIIEGRLQEKDFQNSLLLLQQFLNAYTELEKTLHGLMSLIQQENHIWYYDNLFRERINAFVEVFTGKTSIGENEALVSSQILKNEMIPGYIQWKEEVERMLHFVPTT